MLKDITLGQYFPGNTVAHRLDPRTKILLVTLYIIALFSAKGLCFELLSLFAHQLRPDDGLRCEVENSLLSLSRWCAG